MVPHFWGAIASLFLQNLPCQVLVKTFSYKNPFACMADVWQRSRTERNDRLSQWGICVIESKRKIFIACHDVTSLIQKSTRKS